MQVTFISFVIFLVSLMGCKSTLVEPNYSNENTPMSISIDRPGTYSFSNLQHKDIYITVLNTSRSVTAMHNRFWSSGDPNNILSWKKHGMSGYSSHNNVEINYSSVNLNKSKATDNEPVVEFISKEEFEAMYEEEVTDNESNRPMSGSPSITKFNCNPPQALIDSLREQRKVAASTPSSPEKNIYSNLIDLNGSNNRKGHVRNFWVNSDVAPEDAGYKHSAPEFYLSTRFKKISAECLAVSQHCAVYAATDPDDLYYKSTKITIEDFVRKAELIITYFEKIYTLETQLFGEPYRMSNSKGNSQVEILIYDIDADAASPSIIGFFWGKDYFSPDAYPFSNTTEMFYMDSDFFITNEKIAFSTLIHEFQHMINFNQKLILGGMYNVETWYNEMMSMIAEDMIYPVIEPDDPAGWVMNVRIPDFLTKFHNGSVTHWIDGDITSYSFLAAFGGYLTRNFGGARFVHELSVNAYQGASSIANAIETLYPKRYQNSSAVFTDIFMRFPETMLFTRRNLLKNSFSFEKEVPGSYTSYGGVTYSLQNFSLWPFVGDVDNDDGDGVMSQEPERPYIRDISKDSNAFYRIRIMSFMIFQHPDLKNVSGNLDITFSKLGEGGIKYQIYVVSSPE